jgi:hypothetical protein
VRNLKAATESKLLSQSQNRASQRTVAGFLFMPNGLLTGQDIRQNSLSATLSENAYRGVEQSSKAVALLDHRTTFKTHIAVLRSAAWNGYI